MLMTALTTALGLLPILLSHGTGPEIKKPLAIVVVGGFGKIKCNVNRENPKTLFPPEVDSG